MLRGHLTEMSIVCQVSNLRSFGASAGGDGEVVDGRLVLVVGRELLCQLHLKARG